MRLQFRTLMAAFAVAIFSLMVSCKADDTNFGDPETESPNEEQTDGQGLLAIEDILLAVIEDSEDWEENDDITTKADETGDDTESDDDTEPVINTDDYRIIICKDEVDDNEKVFDKPYSEVKTMIDKLELPVGKYTLQARSCSEIAAVAWNKPEYASPEYKFFINDGETTDLVTGESNNTVKCRLANVKTSVNMSIDLLDLFNREDVENPLTVTLKVGENEAIYYVNDKNIFTDGSESDNLYAYFASDTDGKEMTITLKGAYNTKPADEKAEYTDVVWNQTLKSLVKSGEYRIVTINVEHYNEGKAHIEFRVENWIYDTAIGVDIQNETFITKGEDEIIDPDDFVSDKNSPVVRMAGDLDLPDPYLNTPETYVDEEKYIPYSLTITPVEDATIQFVQLKIFSTNSDFTTDLKDDGFSSGITLWKDGKAVENTFLAPAPTTDEDKDETDTESDTETDTENDDTTTPEEVIVNLNTYLKIMEAEDGSGAMSLDLLYDAAKYLGSRMGDYTIKLTVTDSEGRTSNTRVNIASNSGGLDITWKNGDFDTRHVISANTNLQVKLDITSSKGVSALKIKIVSDILKGAELTGLGLAEEMDLVNPATPKMESMLNSLGFPTRNDVEGKESLTLDISEFMPTLGTLSPAGSKHKTDFVITVEDSTGSCTKTLKLISE